MIDASVKVEGDHLVVFFEPGEPAWARNTTKEAVRDASYGISQRGKYSFALKEEEIARELDPERRGSYIRDSLKGDHKPEKFVDRVSRIRVIV